MTLDQLNALTRIVHQGRSMRKSDREIACEIAKAMEWKEEGKPATQGNGRSLVRAAR